ncbi:MAG: hypothetical protein IT307_19935 [Chloroflexi bacterium]|nr:hypothetical protein [Chloroflexota bacterium]
MDVTQVDLPAAFEPIDDAALERAAARLARFLAQPPTAPDAGAAFVVRAAAGAPEAELSAWLESLGGTETVSFGPREWMGAAWSQASARCEALLDQATRAVGYDAWVETSVDRRVVGRSLASWDGTITTVWQANDGFGLLDQHDRALADALSARTSLIHKAVLIVGGAAALAARLGTPGGLLLALPMVLRFFDQVLAEPREPRQHARPGSASPAA